MAKKKIKPSTEVIEENTTRQVSNKDFYFAVGRKRESSARVRLHPLVDEEMQVGNRVVKKGDIVINDRPIEEYFRGELYTKLYLEPFRTTNTMNRFATTIKVRGGGLSGQLGAIIHGISRALVKVDPEKFRPILKKRDFLTRDPREKERRKAGQGGRARAKKQSPKR